MNSTEEDKKYVQEEAVTRHKTERRKIILFTGLFFLLLATLSYFLGVSPIISQVLLAIGISFKLLFLFYIFRAPNFKMSPPLYMILTGVTLMLLSLLFKTVYPMPLVRTIFFYSAIALKVSGVTLLFYKK